MASSTFCFIRKAVGQLALLALLLSGLVPSGWMVRAEAGSVTFVVCTGDGPVSRTMALGSGKQRAGSDEAPDDSRSSCPFTTAAQPGIAPGEATSLPLVYGSATLPIVGQDHASLVHPACWSTPPSQGPPQTV